MDTQTKETIVKALQAFPTRMGVIGTVTEDNKPRVATIYFDFDENLNIYFITRATTEKYKNATRNNNASFVASVDHPPRTVQIEGEISEVTDSEEQEKYFKRLMNLVKSEGTEPPFAQMMHGEIVVMRITPTIARLGNFDSMHKENLFQTAS